MKSFVLVAAGLTTLICGCASAPAARPYSEYDDVDSAKVALANQHARTNGIAIYWVNYPQRRASAATAPAAAPAVPAGT